MLRLGFKSQVRLAPSARYLSSSIIPRQQVAQPAQPQEQTQPPSPKTAQPKKISSELEQQLEELAEIKASLVQIPKVDDLTQHKASLIKTFEKYDPKVLTQEEIARNMDTPFPVNAELNYYAPLKHEVKYGHLKAEVYFRCFDPRNMEFFADFALRAAYYLGLPATGPKPLPVRRERWTVNRAPFINAKSKENFERRTYSRLIKIWDAEPEIVDLWLGYITKNSVWGVGVKANLYTQQPVTVTSSKDKLAAGAKVVTDLSSTLDTLTKDTSDPVAQKVLELLQDPTFAKFLSKEELKELKSKAGGKK